MGIAALHSTSIALLTLAATLCSPASAQGNGPELVSVDSIGMPGSSTAVDASINYDGRYVVFTSGSPELVPADTNNKPDIFHHDRVTKITTRVNVSSLGAQAQGGTSLYPAISPEGTYVVFTSGADNLVPGDTNGKPDVFRHDLSSGETIRVSVATDGTEPDNGCFRASVSALGRYVAFQSRATNLVAGDTNGDLDVFVHDTLSGTTERVSVSFVGLQLDKGGSDPSISWDGRYVAFQSSSKNAVFGDTNGLSDIFVRDRGEQTTERVSVTSSGGQYAGNSQFPTITADGRLVAFWNQGWAGIFVHDRATGETTQEANGLEPTISTNGLFVAYQGGSSGLFGVQVKNRVTGNTLGIVGGDSRNAYLSGDGGIISYEISSALVPEDTNGEYDIYVDAASNCAPYDVYCTSSSSSILGCTPLISASGTPAMSDSSGFTVSCSSLVGGNNVGMFFFGDNGPANFSVGTMGGKMCVLPPFDRSAPKATGGLPGVCNGYLEFGLDELEAGSNLITAGKVIHGEFWVRDLDNQDGFVFSNGVTFTLCP